MFRNVLNTHFPVLNSQASVSESIISNCCCKLDIYDAYFPKCQTFLWMFERISSEMFLSWNEFSCDTESNLAEVTQQSPSVLCSFPLLGNESKTNVIGWRAEMHSKWKVKRKWRGLGKERLPDERTLIPEHTLRSVADVWKHLKLSTRPPRRWKNGVTLSRFRK